MSLVDTLIVERACERLCVDYAHRADERSDDFADLFTPDAQLLLVDVECRGQKEILAFIRRRRAEGLLTRHLCANVAITMLSSTEATGIVDCTYFVGRPVEGIARKRTLAPHAVGTYTDRYRLTADGWRIAHRSYRLVFLRADPAS